MSQATDVRNIDKIRLMRELDASDGRLLLETVKRTFINTDIDTLLESLKDKVKITEFNSVKYIESIQEEL